MLIVKPMFFNVSGLIQDGIGATRIFEVDGWLSKEDGQSEQLVGKAHMLRTKDGVLVQAHLELVEPEVCSRCLEPLIETVKIEFEEEFLTTTDTKTGAFLHDMDPDSFTIDEHHTLDLTEAVRQYREVSNEMQPLCRPDCRGLCPTCGKDLNQGDCDCDDGSIDVRWAGLAALKGAMPEGKEQ